MQPRIRFANPPTVSVSDDSDTFESYGSVINHESIAGSFEDARTGAGFRDANLEAAFASFFQTTFMIRGLVGLIVGSLVGFYLLRQWLPLFTGNVGIFILLQVSAFHHSWEWIVLVAGLIISGPSLASPMNTALWLLFFTVLLTLRFLPHALLSLCVLGAHLFIARHNAGFWDVVFILAVCAVVLVVGYIRDRAHRHHFFLFLRDSNVKRPKAKPPASPATAAAVRALKKLRESRTTQQDQRVALDFVTEMLVAGHQVRSARLRLPSNVDRETADWVATELEPRPLQRGPSQAVFAAMAREKRGSRSMVNLFAEEGSEEGQRAASAPGTSHWHTLSQSVSTGRLAAAARDAATEFIPGTVLSDTDTAALTARLDTALEAGWNADVFAIADATHGHPLFFVALHLMNHRHGLVDELGIDLTKLTRLLTRLEAGYHKNPYHNNIHATDVLICTEYLLTSAGIREVVDDIDLFAALLAACAHDVGHTGQTNGYHVATASDFAITYNDISVLENHHCATLFRMMREDGCDVLSHMDVDNQRRIRGVITSMVLATDMSKHLQLMASIKTRLASGTFMAYSKVGETEDDNEAAEYGDSDRTLMLQIALKAADVSHTSKATALHEKWTERVVAEFFAQGDMERERGLPISPFMDREKSNRGFFVFAIVPLFTAVTECLEYEDIILGQVEANKDMWSKRCEEEENEESGV